MRIAVVTATIDLERAARCLDSWSMQAELPLTVYLVTQLRGPQDWEERGTVNRHRVYHYGHRELLGVVPAFALGLQQALADGHDIIALLHDDLEILPRALGHRAWDQTVRDLFLKVPEAGLCGFGGAKGIGDEDIYQSPYRPIQLVRKDFLSNMRDAESHGRRSTLAEKVACLDGFSQIGRREFWMGADRVTGLVESHYPTVLDEMAGLQIIHHAYDTALGAYAALNHWETWFLPVPVHHYGGRTAVGDTRYHTWADEQTYGARTEAQVLGQETGTGDQWFWAQSHKAVYTRFRDTGVLPLRVL